MPNERLTNDLAVSANTESGRVAARLKLQFALLSCLGGLVLSAGNDNEAIPVIAVFFAFFGYVFVDWLELFALPPIAAYAAMAVAAVFCVGNFSDLDSPGNQQMEAVAQLLVLVQSILMLQRKSRRIFEQLGVFCLLELIVAAVFNDAINYGLLIIPISVIGAWALSLLSVVSAWEGLAGPEWIGGEQLATDRTKRRPHAVISVSSASSISSLAASGDRLPRVALFALGPAVVAIGMIFFYALPRTTDAARMGDRTNTLVGFSDEVRLEQIGRMMQSSESVLRIHMKRLGADRPYRVVGGMYLRAKVLERYRAHIDPGRATAIWSAEKLGPISGAQRLPNEYFSADSGERNFYDTVNMDVTCESLHSPSLFAVAPYHRRRFDPEVVHRADRWCIARRPSNVLIHPRINYSFGSNAFRRGVQTDLIVRRTLSERMISPADNAAAKREREYMQLLTEFDVDRIPTAAILARGISKSVRSSGGNEYQVAKQMEQHLAVSGRFGYTLDLTAEARPGIDPIEQFLSVDKKGHCQYFASAIVMMLRSQGIPARIVVGYRTDEYNDFAQFYVARQLHAHAWAEALISRDQLGPTRTVYGQPPGDEYWLRLDPTPGGGGVEDSDARTVGQVFDLAQNIWDDYVVDMDGNRQNEAMSNSSVSSPLSSSYSRFVEVVAAKLAEIRAGELGGGALAIRGLFSWPAAGVGVIATVVMIILSKTRFPGWVRRKVRRRRSQEVLKPTIGFYLATLNQLARLGITRGASQTPAELAVTAGNSFRHHSGPPISDPLDVLTSAFYEMRFGTAAENAAVDLQDSDPEVAQALEQLTERVDRMVSRSSNQEPPL